VFETDEEQISDQSEQNKRGRKKKKVFTLGQFSQLMKFSKIYQDDFDLSTKHRSKKGIKGSVVDHPDSRLFDEINEVGNESEGDELNSHLSDGSSSNFSFRKSKFSLDLSKLIDKLEPRDNFSDIETSQNIVPQAKYLGKINEPIDEEDDEKEEALEEEEKKARSSSGLISPQMQNVLK